eukprot:scaffold24636_cov31-Tisochrysis_lutea.AAC.4
MTVGFVARAHSRLIVDRHCCNSLDDKVIGSQRPCLIEAAEGELARQRDTERFGTEDIVPKHVGEIGEWKGLAVAQG